MTPLPPSLRLRAYEKSELRSNTKPALPAWRRRRCPTRANNFAPYWGAKPSRQLHAPWKGQQLLSAMPLPCSAEKLPFSSRALKGRALPIQQRPQIHACEELSQMMIATWPLSVHSLLSMRVIEDSDSIW